MEKQKASLTKCREAFLSFLLDDDETRIPKQMGKMQGMNQIWVPMT